MPIKKTHRISKLHLFYLSFIIAILQSSCSGVKDIVMFQESNNTLKQFDIPITAPNHKIKPHDNLYLSILTLDPEVNKLFNPSSGGDGFTSGTEQMFGTPTSQYINGYRVAEDGTITLPILGELNLAGLCIDDAQKRLKERAEEYLKEPTIQVKLLNFKVNVLGEIRNPGIYYNYEGSINILDAISMANGITDYADIKNVLVKRYDDNKIKTYSVNFTNKSVYSSEVFYLQPNDLIYIPPSKIKRSRENSNTYSQILSTISTLLVALALFLKN